MATPVSMNLNEVLAAIAGKTPKGTKQAKLGIGFSAPYAVYVHENLEANHPNGGQAKFLEAAFRDGSVQQQMREAMQRALKNKRSLNDAMTDAANVLLRAAMALCPVDTGELRDSGFVDVR